ncbi:MAG TPA: cation:proton antiporter, partial [Alphaproteobacteria bacterium]
MPPDLLALIHDSLFYQFALILLIAGAAGFVALQLRQPLVVAFIAAGLLIGPDALNIVSEESNAIETLAKIGISLLLFMVGLKLDINLIHKLGGVALATAIGQMAFT